MSSSADIDAASMQECGHVYFGRVEMPWENLQAAADRGLTFAGFKKCDSVFGYVSAIVMARDEAREALQLARPDWLSNFHSRRGVDLFLIPEDLSQRADHELASDEIFCEWQIAVRQDLSDAEPLSIGGQDVTRWSYRVTDIDPDELAYFRDGLQRIKAEIAKRAALTDCDATRAIAGLMEAMQPQ